MPVKLPAKTRLHRLIAQCTELSRRSAEEAIAAGRVSVNGVIVTALGTSVAPSDRVQVDGRLVVLPEKHVYIAFNKPSRTIVSKSDPQGRATIWSLLSRWKHRLNSAGRLDFDAEGLLLLSSDGDFLQRLTHPRYELWKTYRVQVKGKPSAALLARLASGVKLEEGMTAPAKVKVVKETGTHIWIQLSIREGKNRQVKRMCEAIGHPVIKLKRIGIGPVKLRGITSGAWRFLSAMELSRLTQELSGQPRPVFRGPRRR